MSEKRQPPPPKRAERAKNKFSGNHQRSWLWGHYAVLETLATGVWSAKLTQPTALIIGSEATGVQSELLAACDQRLWIPMLGRVSSLNAAVAAGILLYEIRRQQHTTCEM